MTTITPSVRYIGIRAWLIWCYGQSGLPDNWASFTYFSARLETAIVLANLNQDRSISGLIGADQAMDRLNANTPSLSTAPLIIAPAVTIYAGPSDQLRVRGARREGVPGLDQKRGTQIAHVLDKRFSKTSHIEQMLSRNDLNEISTKPLGF